MKKYQVILNINELEDCVDFQKKCLINFAEFSHKYNDQKNFEIFAVGLALVISNVIATFGLSNIDEFLKDIVTTIKTIHDDVKKNAKYMEFRKGEKVNEGSFN